MNWEELKVYRPLKKEDLKTAYKDFTKIIGEKLLQDGFELRGRKLIRQSNDLFHIIHLDTRGSWIGTSDYFKIEIAICSVFDTDTLVLNYELTASKKIEDLVPKIRDYYRITQEYPLLADFLTRKFKESIFPYFSKYEKSKDILNNRTRFKIDNLTEITERNQNLVLYCELANGLDIDSSKILTTRLIKLKNLNPNSPAMNDDEFLLHLVKEKDLQKIHEILSDKKEKVFKKLKLK